jgi:hypothetical protein
MTLRGCGFPQRGALRATLAFVPPGGGKAAQAGMAQWVTVECGFARSPYSSRSYNRKCDTYDSSGLGVKDFGEAAY